MVWHLASLQCRRQCQAPSKLCLPCNAIRLSLLFAVLQVGYPLVTVLVCLVDAENYIRQVESMADFLVKQMKVKEYRCGEWHSVLLSPILCHLPVDVHSPGLPILLEALQVCPCGQPCN